MVAKIIMLIDYLSCSLTVEDRGDSVLEVDDGGRAAADAVLPLGELGVGHLDEVQVRLAAAEVVVDRLQHLDHLPARSVVLLVCNVGVS